MRDAAACVSTNLDMAQSMEDSNNASESQYAADIVKRHAFLREHVQISAAWCERQTGVWIHTLSRRFKAAFFWSAGMLSDRDSAALLNSTCIPYSVSTAYICMLSLALSPDDAVLTSCCVM